MVKTFGCCRKAYNYYLEKRKAAWETERKLLSGFDCMKDLTMLKKTKDFACTDVPEKHLPKTGKSVGIDLNSADNLMTFSDGTVIPNHKFLKQSQKKIARLQKELSRKTSGSENWKKARIKLARAMEHVANQRKDYINKLTTDIVRKYDNICIEDLKVSEMQKNHFGAKAAQEVSFYEIRRQLEYKCAWYGKNLHIVDRYFPSSQLCSFCGWKNPKTKDLSIREWDCPCCGVHHVRDLNAALNILQEGLTK